MHNYSLRQSEVKKNYIWVTGIVLDVMAEALKRLEAKEKLRIWLV